MSQGRQRLSEIAVELKSEAAPVSETVRTLLAWFGAQRRGYYVVQEINRALDEAGLITEPDFEAAFIDSEVYFRLKPTAEAADATVEIFHLLTTGDVHPSTELPAAYADPTYRLSKLEAANRTPLSVKPDTSLSEVVTILMANDFSQVPVMTTDREVKGAVSWKSIASRLGLGIQGSVAQDFMDPAPVLESDKSLFAAIPLIIESQYVLIRAADRRIVGIVTASDLSLQFQQLAEPFLLLGEIENQLRRMLNSKFSAADLRDARDPADASREINSVHDLTFGEYIRLLQSTANWSRLGLAADRATFVKMLTAVRDIRNDVMHFDPDAVPEDDLAVLRDFARFLQRLQEIGAT